MPQSGKDQEYDSIMTEINEIEDELQDDLSTMEEELKWVPLSLLTAGH